MPSFTIGESDFLLDGRPHRVLSGALHYFRVHPDLWADRIRKARQMGLNTIETYIPWNEHAPTRGEFRTAGILDLARFLDLIAAEGMHAIVRPGPYICAEWDRGGLPAWLTADADVRPRSSDPRYLDPVIAYLEQVYDIVRPRQIGHGGPVVLVQIENEYGAYGDDVDYLRTLTAATREAGITVPLITVDQPTDAMLAAGSLPELHRTGSFGSRATERLATLRTHQRTGPLMCSEFWCGWFDSVGEHHATTSAEDAAAELDAILAAGGSVNVYMFHGGTNFGLTNGANDKGVHRAISTSYDYDAPLAEDGTPTAKYWAFREVISRYAPVPEDVPAGRVAAPVLDVVLEHAVPLCESGVTDFAPVEGVPTAGDVGVDRGWLQYRTNVERGGVLTIGEVRDHAVVTLDGAVIGTLERDRHERAIVVPRGGELTLLVGILGGVNYGPRLGEAVGLIGPVALDREPVTGWEAGAVDLTNLASLSYRAVRPDAPLAGPVFATGTFTLDGPADLFLATDGWHHGAVWVNGFALGRHTARGPQRTMYVPAPVLRAGENSVVVFETRAALAPRLHTLGAPDLGPTER